MKAWNVVDYTVAKQHDLKADPSTAFMIELRRVSPWKTSQFCRFCGKWDRRSRGGKVFMCVHCGHTDDADMNGVQNIRLLGLAGVYSLRSLPNKFTGRNICL